MTLPDLKQIALWREQYQQQRATAIDAYLARPRVAPLLAALTTAVDALLHEVWAAFDLPPTAALVAVGGYGRSEQFPQSDVDLLILIKDDLPEVDLARFEPLIGVFWDCGLPVGHSVRRLHECLSEAAHDLTIQTNLLEARHLCGDAALTRQLGHALHAHLDPHAFLQGKQREQAQRHGRFSDRALSLEPNLKESPGGLRDLHMLGWVARACGIALDEGGRRTKARPTAQPTWLLAPDEARALRRQRQFLSHLRIRLHLAARRREERLLFEFQERIAAEMGFTATPTRRASERLMQGFYRSARAISLANEILLGEMEARISGHTPTHLFAHLFDIADATAFATDPAALLGSFQALQVHPECGGFTPRALRLLSHAAPRIDAAFRRDPARQAQFLAILNEPRGVTLAVRLLHRLGLLNRYIPSFARITGQMQHDLYHIHPVDEHSLMLLRNLRRFALPEFAHEFPLASNLMQDMAEPGWLYLAALFHDIAKGRGGDHSTLGAVIVRRFCREQRLPAAATQLLTWLVREHLALSQVAQKHDLSDPEVIAAFATRCGDVSHLNALYLITVADIRATNPALWNAWKDNLLKTLYHATRAHLEGHAIRTDKQAEARATLRLYGWPEGAERLLWNRLDEVWFLRFDAAAIAWQTRALLPALHQKPAPETLVRTRLSPIGAGADCLVYTPDRPGLFARICGFFAAMGYSVLEARIHTTRDGHALDSFLVMDSADHGHAQTDYRAALHYIEYELTQTLNQGADPTPINGRLTRQLRAFPLAPQVSLTRSEGRRDFVLNLSAGDRPGLLYSIARTLAAHDANVRSARIHTLGGRAEDVFVVEGPTLDNSDARLALERALLDELQIAL
jgi:[protein-PII] uridylyltransferase